MGMTFQIGDAFMRKLEKLMQHQLLVGSIGDKNFLNIATQQLGWMETTQTLSDPLGQ